MARIRSAKSSSWLIAISALLLATLACQALTGGEPSEETVESTESAETQAVEEPTLTPTIIQEATAVPKPTEAIPTEEPTAEPTEPPATKAATPKSILLVDQGFGQDGSEIGYAFLVENPNPGQAVEGSEYQLAALDAEGVILETDSGFIELILPGQTLGVGGSLFLDEGLTVESIEVQLNPGQTVDAEDAPGFEAASVRYFPDEFGSTATGVVTNPYPEVQEDVLVSAVAYNAAGEIVGGGYTYLNFINAGTASGVEVFVTTEDKADRIELYPTYSGLSFLSSGNELPEGASDLILSKYGWGQSEDELGYGMLIENPNPNHTVESAMYHLTAYAEDGSVVAVDEGYVNLLLPGELHGQGGDLYLEEGVTVSNVDVQIRNGRFEPSEPLPFFTAENIAHLPGDFSDTVTGRITNPFDQDISDVRVSAILYNEAGDIIGGGFTFLDFVPASGAAPAEVFVTSSDPPARSELYTAITSLSDFE